jgi:hypothetical protein
MDEETKNVPPLDEKEEPLENPIFPREILSAQYDLHQEKIEAMSRVMIELGMNPLEFDIITKYDSEGTLKSWFQRRVGSMPS